LKKFCYSITALFIILFLATPLFAAKITIMHVNDSHMNLLPGGSRDVQLQAHVGGIAKMASVVGAQKMADPNTLFFHSGDISIGDLFYCKYFAVPELKILGQLGCNGLELGNHEFDLGTDALLQVLTIGMAASKFPVLCSNCGLGDPAVKNLEQYISKDTIYNIGGIKIGVFGLITEDTKLISNPGKVEIQDIMSAINDEINSLKTRNCDVIILISHLGEIYDRIVAGTPYLNLILGGHDHFLYQPTAITRTDGSKCYITQAGAFYQYVNKIVLDVTGTSVTLDETNSMMIELDANVPQEPTIKATLDAMITDIESTYGPVYTQKIADVPDTLIETSKDLDKVGFHDTQVANLVADAFKAWGKTDIALTACGSTSHDLFKGPIVAADIYRMMGYGFNTVNALGFRMVKFNLKGSSFLAGLQFGLSNMFFSDDFLIQCSGMKYTYKFYRDLYNIKNNFGLLENVTINGLPIDTSKYYSVTSNEGLIPFMQLLKMDYQITMPPSDTTEFMVVSGFCQALQNVTSKVEGRVECPSVVGVKENITPSVSLNNNVFPFPCTDKVSVSFNLPESGNYTFKIYDSKANLITSAPSEYIDAGSFTKTIDTRLLPAGLYIYSMSDGNQRILGRILVSR